MQNLTHKQFQKGFIFTILCLVYQISFAQYPEIPHELQAKTDSILAKEDVRLQKIWEDNYDIILNEAKNGRPYIPWAAYPGDL